MSRLDVDLRSVDITLTEDAAFNLIDTPEGPEAVVHLTFADLRASVTIPLALVHRISAKAFDVAMQKLAKWRPGSQEVSHRDLEGEATGL